MTGHLVGVDLGGTNMQIGVIDDAGSLVVQHKCKTRADRGADHVYTRLVEAIERACAEAGFEPGSLRAVGLAAAAAVNSAAGVILEAPNIGWRDFPIAEALRGRLGAPVALENDVNAAVVGEHRFGALRGESEALGVWIGTGVGGAVILNGALHRGAFETAGEIGHITLIPGAPLGARTLEDVCSRSAVVARLAKLARSKPTMLHDLAPSGVASIRSSVLARAYHAGDPLTREVVDESADLLGVGIGSCATLLSIPVIILGGGLVEAIGAPYVERIRESVRRHVFPESVRGVRIVETMLREKAGVLGAGAIAADRFRAEQ